MVKFHGMKLKVQVHIQVPEIPLNLQLFTNKNRENYLIIMIEE
jgi:hypothetical protein